MDLKKINEQKKKKVTTYVYVPVPSWNEIACYIEIPEKWRLKKEMDERIITAHFIITTENEMKYI